MDNIFGHAVYKATMLAKRYIFLSLCLSLHGPTTEGKYNIP